MSGARSDVSLVTARARAPSFTNCFARPPLDFDNKDAFLPSCRILLWSSARVTNSSIHCCFHKLSLKLNSTVQLRFFGTADKSNLDRSCSKKHASTSFLAILDSKPVAIAACLVRKATGMCSSVVLDNRETRSKIFSRSTPVGKGKASSFGVLCPTLQHP